MSMTASENQKLSTVRDSFNRPMHDLRISVIDRCNFRCTYCMPEQNYPRHYTFLRKRDWLSFDEIARLTRLFVQSGVTKVRITGGEPLLRPRVEDLVAQLTTVSGIEDLALTTNGSKLAEKAGQLKKTGLSRLTVSLDTLDERIFREMNGYRSRVQAVLDGIRAAEEAGFQKIKINAVIQKGVNDQTVMPLVEHFRGTGHIVRFIEYMDVGNCNHWESRKVVPNLKILKRIHSRYPLEPVERSYFGEVAERYRFVDGHGEIGFISSVSQPFCGTCTRLRLSTDGKVYTCLFAAEGTDVRAPLRSGADDAALLQIINNLWQKRADKYSENRTLFQSLKLKPSKVEMYQIGG